MKVNFFLVLILAIVFFEINQESFTTELKELSTTIRGYVPEFSSANNENESNSYNEEYDVSVDYVSNNLGGENNNTEVSNYSSTTNTASPKNENTVQATSSKTTENTNDMYAANNNTPVNNYDYRPNNSSNAGTQYNSYTDQVTTSTTIDEASASSSRETTPSISTEPTLDDNTNSLATPGAPNPPGGGGQDPFQVPLDDYYAIIFLLVVSSIMGLLSLKKLKIV